MILKQGRNFMKFPHLSGFSWLAQILDPGVSHPTTVYQPASELKPVEASSAAAIRMRLPMASDERYSSNSEESLVHGCALAVRICWLMHNEHNEDAAEENHELYSSK